MKHSVNLFSIMLLLLQSESQSFPLILIRRHNSESPVRLAAIPVIKEQDSATSGSRNASEWHIWKTADKLQLTGISLDKDLSESTQGIINRIIPILYDWGEKWAGRNEWQGLLNKSSLLHEVEESIVALSFLLEFLERRVGHTPDLQQITVVDVACGKGVMSMISSYLFQNDDRIKKIIMLDKADINWDHIEKANLSAEKENRPFIECWSSCNLHEIDGIVKRLETQTPVALVGIHLCKTLSPTCIGIVNSLTAKHCPFFVLAPCCLPRIATQSLQKHSIGEKSIMKVRRYESIDERRRRMESKLKRDAALSRRPPTTMSDQLEMMQSNPCWKCGETGHLKAECPSIQATSKPRLIQPPYVDVDISHVLLSESPFTLYCELLSSSLLREKVKVVDTGLANEKAKHQNGNWNKGRKAMYIVAESSSF